jgi:hypothetical protein
VRQQQLSCRAWSNDEAPEGARSSRRPPKKHEDRQKKRKTYGVALGSADMVKVRRF